MSRIPDDDMDVCREAIRRHDIEAIVRWHKSHYPISESVCRETYRICFRAHDTARALWLFEKTAGCYDPAAARISTIVRVLITIIIIAAVAGGIKALFA